MSSLKELAERGICSVYLDNLLGSHWCNKKKSFSDDARLLSLGSGCVIGRTEILYLPQSSVNHDGVLTDNAGDTSRLVPGGTPTIGGGRVHPDRISTLYDARTSL